MNTDKTARLDSGMRVDEAIDRARKWWGEWRGAIARDFNRIQGKPLVRGPVAGAPGLIIQDPKREDLPSGILSGKAWGDLTDREKLRVVRAWREHHRPQ